MLASGASLGQAQVVSSPTATDCAACDSAPAEGQTWLERLDELAIRSRADGSRWSRIEYDFDDRGFNVLHFMGNSPLPFGFNLWGFIDLEGEDVAGANREDLSRFFLEIDLKKRIWSNGGLIAEYNDLQGDNNAIGRLGFYYQPQLDCLSPTQGWFAGKGLLGFKVFPYETDGYGGQASFHWNKRFEAVLDGRFSAGGFFDLNYNAGASHDRIILVTEHQVRFRVAEGLHMITEFRVNEFLRDDFGIAPGVQYRF